MKNKKFVFATIVKVSMWYLKTIKYNSETQNSLSKNAHNSNAKLEVPGGAFFSLLVCTFIIYTLNGIDLAIESYGIKDYCVINCLPFANEDKIIGNHLQKQFLNKKKKNISSNPLLIVKAFNSYCKKYLCENSKIKLCVGLGSTVSNHTAYDIPCYTVINPILPSKTTSVLYKFDQYPVYGGIIPVEMRPTTVSPKTITQYISCETKTKLVNNIVRLQHYSKTARVIPLENKTKDGEGQSSKKTNYNR
jgi:hypothetical protein